MSDISPSVVSPLAPPLCATLTAASRALAAVLAGQTPEALLAKLSPALRPATLDLTYSTLRDYGRGDFILGQLLAKPLKDKPIHALLLVALARLERRPEEAHTIVDQAVAAADKLTAGRLKGLCNAVLRNFLRRRPQLTAAAQQDPVAHWQHPRWWLTRLRKDFPQQWQSICAAGNSHPPMCLRVNQRQTTVAAYHETLQQAGVVATRFDGDSHALLLEKAMPVEQLPGFRQGLVSVQDWGAQQAVALLDVEAGQRVLDACAAPGGKTTQLLEQTTAEVTALELHAPRAKQLRENLSRLGLSAEVLVADASQPQTWWDQRLFERILVDAPCSASGVVRRHPDIKWLRRDADIAAFVHKQAIILDALWPILAAGGKMLYCTCSVFSQENEKQIKGFLLRHADARVVELSPAKAQLLPTAQHDGFYFASLIKGGQGE